MSYTQTHFMFRSLDDAECDEFRAHARSVAPDPDKWHLMHPVCRQEWVLRGLDCCTPGCADCTQAYAGLD